jgi:hypothetical protein
MALVADGIDCGGLAKIEGGNAVAEVVTVAQSGQYWDRKHIANVKFEAMKASLLGIHGGPIYDRIKQLLANDHQYFQGAVHAYDFNMKTKAIKEFKDALMTEVTFPTCDGSTKEPAYLSITWQPQECVNLKGDDSNQPGAWKAQQKTLSGSNFRLTVDKIKDACKFVNKVEPLTIKAPAGTDQVGDGRIYTNVPTSGVNYPNLEFSLAESAAELVYQWHQDFVIKGNCSEEAETTAELTYFDQALAKELIKITFFNVGIYNLVADPFENHKETIRRVKVSAYCERMLVEFPGAG